VTRSDAALTAAIGFDGALSGAASVVAAATMPNREAARVASKLLLETFAIIAILLQESGFAIHHE